MATSFGQVVPVTGLTIGFPGTVSRMAGNIITARQVLPTAASNLSFGSPTVIIPNASGGGDTIDSVADFIGSYSGTFANAGLVAAYFAGIAVREVKTAISYPAGTTPGILQVGFYQAGEEGENLELGNVPVVVTAGTPASQGQVYTRVALNTAQVPAGFVGDIEAGGAGSNDTVSTTGSASSGSTSLTVASATNLQKGQIVTGAGIAPNTSVTNVSGTTITLSIATTAALSTTPVTFSNLVALPNTVFRTGYLDANTSVAEITIKIRNVA